jgi:hypothetical protein
MKILYLEELLESHILYILLLNLVTELCTCEAESLVGLIFVMKTLFC